MQGEGASIIFIWQNTFFGYNISTYIYYVINVAMSLPIPKYSDEYIDSVRDRFPEFEDYTKSQLISALDKNEHREHGMYEEEVKSAFETLEQEITFPDSNRELVTYIFEELDPIFADRIKSGISYAIQKWSKCDLVLWSQLEDGPKDRESTIAPKIAYPQNFQFIEEKSVSSQKESHLREKKEILFVLSVNKTGNSDSLWRPEYHLEPKLVEIPPKTAQLANWLWFQKDLDLQWFKESVQKFSA